MHWNFEVKVSKDMAFSRSTFCRAFCLASATWWAPALQAHCHGKEGEGAVRGDATAQLLCNGAWLQRGHEHAGIRHPPTHAHALFKNFSRPHGITCGCWQWKLICLCKGWLLFTPACPPFPLGLCAGTSLASVCKPQCIQTSLVQYSILVLSTPLVASPG